MLAAQARLRTGLRGPGAPTPPQTPLLFRDSMRGTLRETSTGKVRRDDGETWSWLKYTEGISKVQFCTYIQKKIIIKK